MTFKKEKPQIQLDTVTRNMIRYFITQIVSETVAKCNPMLIEEKRNLLILDDYIEETFKDIIKLNEKKIISEINDFLELTFGCIK